MRNIIRDVSHHLSPHFFDFIVVDESHHSIYNSYKEVLDYFKTMTLGIRGVFSPAQINETLKLTEELAA